VSDKQSLEIRVSVDVRYRRHRVAIASQSGEVLEEFEIAHGPEGFAQFFSRIQGNQEVRICQVAVPMEGSPNTSANPSAVDDRKMFDKSGPIEGYSSDPIGQAAYGRTGQTFLEALFSLRDHK